MCENLVIARPIEDGFHDNAIWKGKKIKDQPSNQELSSYPGETTETSDQELNNQSKFPIKII